MSQLESKLLAVAEVSEKEEENKEILETLRRELKQAEMSNEETQAVEKLNQ